MNAPRRAPGDGATSRLGDVARSLVSTSGRRRARFVDAVADAWALAAGPALAATTRVASVREGVVAVTTRSAPLCHELASFRREALLAELNERLREAGAAGVTSLIFRVGSA